MILNDPVGQLLRSPLKAETGPRGFQGIFCFVHLPVSEFAQTKQLSLTLRRLLWLSLIPHPVLPNRHFLPNRDKIIVNPPIGLFKRRSTVTHGYNADLSGHIQSNPLVIVY
jgi:hypothetical protein